MKMKVDYDYEDMLVIFNVVDADDKIVESETFPFEHAHESCRDRISLYGLNKLLTDRTSGEKDKRKKLHAMTEYMALLAAGEWAKERVVGAPIVSVEVEALAALRKLTVPQAQEALAQYDKETRKRILARDDVQAKAKEIREDRESHEVASLDDLV